MGTDGFVIGLVRIVEFGSGSGRKLLADYANKGRAVRSGGKEGYEAVHFADRVDVRGLEIKVHRGSRAIMNRVW